MNYCSLTLHVYGMSCAVHNFRQANTDVVELLSRFEKITSRTMHANSPISDWFDKCMRIEAKIYQLAEKFTSHMPISTNETMLERVVGAKRTRADLLERAFA